MEVYPNQKIHEASRVQERLKVFPFHEKPKMDQVQLTDTDELQETLRALSAIRPEKVAYAKLVIDEKQYPSEKELNAIAQHLARSMYVTK